MYDRVVSYTVGNSKSVAAAKLLESAEAVKMDQLTVTRLRAECRLRRLPVSGRKRNLVLRLLPFADVILGGTGNAAESAEERREAAAACRSAAAGGVTHVLAQPSTTAAAAAAADRPQSTAAAPEVEFHPPFVPLDSFISGGGWSGVDGDDWALDGQAVVGRSSAVDQLECVADATRPSAVNHVEVLTEDGDAEGAENESLVCRWLRQQRLIDELRSELCRYRRALAAARFQTLARSSSSTADDPRSSLRLFSDVGADDDISRYPPAEAYFASKR